MSLLSKIAPRAKHVVAAAAGAVALIAISGSVLAGLKMAGPVQITVNGSEASASGGLGTARHSIDNNQYIECTVQGFSGGNSAVFCAAQDSNGKAFSCTANASNHALATSVAGIGPNSRLFIFAINGVCPQID